MAHAPQGAERRQFVRVKKNYILRFYQKNNPSFKYEVSQVENISKGGLCFTSTIPCSVGDLLAIELRTPYIADIVYLEGKVLSVDEKVKGLIYQNRLQFLNISLLAEDILAKIEKYNAKENAQGAHHRH